MFWVFLIKRGKSKNLQFCFRIITDPIVIYWYLLSEVWLYSDVLFLLDPSFEHNEENANRAKAQARRDSKQNHRQAAVWDRCERGSEHINKTNRVHALAIRAAAAVAAAVPEQSPPASRLWGATPESPYWSLEWAETHFLWAQVTWRKEQKRVEAHGHRVMRRKTKKRWGVGEAMCQVGVRGEEVEGQRGEESSKTKKERKQKIIEDLSQAEAGLLRHSMLIEE